MAESLSLASSAFPGNAKVQKKMLESRDLKFNENFHMKLINRTLDEKIRPRAVTLDHGMDNSSTGRDLAQEPVTENPYESLSPRRESYEANKNKEGSLSVHKLMNPSFTLKPKKYS
jgi:hypothetical protein